MVGAQPGPPVTRPYYPAQPFDSGSAPPQDTRPSQPVPVTLGQTPSQPVPVIHSNATMGMPPQYGSVPGYSQPMSPLHANTTMGMPASNQYPGNGQTPHPSEPVPAIHANTTMGMPTYGPPTYDGPPTYGPQPSYQQPLPQNQAIYSSSTMMMPVGAAPYAMQTPSGQAAPVDYGVANAAYGPNPSKANQPQQKDGGEDEEEINVLAVVIFGSLSVTALGGLGMLILLMFAT